MSRQKLFRKSKVLKKLSIKGVYVGGGVPTSLLAANLLQGLGTCIDV